MSDSIFAKIAAAKAAKNPGGPLTNQQTSAPQPPQAASAPRATGMRLPTRSARAPQLPDNVTVQHVPDPDLEFDTLSVVGEGAEYDESDLYDDDEEAQAEADRYFDDGDEEAVDEQPLEGADYGFGVVKSEAPAAPKKLMIRSRIAVKRAEPKSVTTDAADLGAITDGSPAPVTTVPNADPMLPPSPGPIIRKPVISHDSPLGKLRAASAPGFAKTRADAIADAQNLMTERFPEQTEPVKEASGGRLGMSMPSAGKATALTGLSPTARAMVESAVVEKVYSVEQFMQDWPALPDMPDDPDEIQIREFNNERKELLRKVTARIQQVFETELAGLAVAQASDFALKEISNLVKLTFVRVKSAPGAYALLDLEDRAQLIKAMRAMAAKRNSAVKSRKPKDAEDLSSALDALGFNPDDGNDGMGGFDLTAFGV